MSSQTASPTPPTSNTSLTDELKLFYAGFDRINTEAPIKAEPPPDDLPLLLTSEVCFYLSRVNAHKVSGPDGLAGRVLRVCTEQLADVFTHIFSST